MNHNTLTKHELRATNTRTFSFLHLFFTADVFFVQKESHDKLKHCKGILSLSTNLVTHFIDFVSHARQSATPEQEGGNAASTWLFMRQHNSHSLLLCNSSFLSPPSPFFRLTFSPCSSLCGNGSKEDCTGSVSPAGSIRAALFMESSSINNTK